MKPSDLADLIEAFSDHVSSRGGNAENMTIVAALVRNSNAATVPALTKLISALEVADNLEGRGILPEIEELSAMARLLRKAGAASASKDIEALSNALNMKRRSSLRALLDAIAQAPTKKSRAKAGAATVVEDVVKKHVRRLEQALGDDVGFNTAMADLEADPQVGKGEIAAIAKRFAFATATSRVAALKKIHARHDALMTSRARSAATAGRIAG